MNVRTAVIFDDDNQVITKEHIRAAMRQYQLDGIVARPYLVPPALRADLLAAVTKKAQETPVMNRAARRRLARGRR